MENKVLIKLLVPELDTSFDIFIPVNEVIWKIKKLLIKSIAELSSVNLDINKEYTLLNIYNSRVYGNNEIVINTDIRNSAELVFMTKKL